MHVSRCKGGHKGQQKGRKQSSKNANEFDTFLWIMIDTLNFCETD